MPTKLIGIGRIILGGLLNEILFYITAKTEFPLRTNVIVLIFNHKTFIN